MPVQFNPVPFAVGERDLSEEKLTQQLNCSTMSIDDCEKCE